MAGQVGNNVFLSWGCGVRCLCHKVTLTLKGFQEMLMTLPLLLPSFLLSLSSHASSLSLPPLSLLLPGPYSPSPHLSPPSTVLHPTLTGVCMWRRNEWKVGHRGPFRPAGTPSSHRVEHVRSEKSCYQLRRETRNGSHSRREGFFVGRWRNGAAGTRR